MTKKRHHRGRTSNGTGSQWSAARVGASRTAPTEGVRRKIVGVGDARATAGSPDYVQSLPPGIDGHGFHLP